MDLLDFDKRVIEAFDAYNQEGSDENFVNLTNIIIDELPLRMQSDAANLKLVVSSMGKEGDLQKAVLTLGEMEDLIPSRITNTTGYKMVWGTLNSIINSYVNFGVGAES